MSLPKAIQQALETQFPIRLQHSRSIGGGCIHNAQQIITDKGPFFLKYNQPSQLHNFEVEAKGLSLLATHCSLTIPKVIGKGQTDDHAFLLMEWVERVGLKGKGFGESWEKDWRGCICRHSRISDWTMTIISGHFHS